MIVDYFDTVGEKSSSYVTSENMLYEILMSILFFSVSGAPPSFTPDGEPPGTFMVDLEAAGNNLVLPCGVTGTPTPIVSWFREGTRIDPASVMANGTLSMRVTAEDGAAPREGANYYCIATNMIGPGNSITAALRSRNVNVSRICEFK